MAESYKNQELIAPLQKGDVEEFRRLINALGTDSLRGWSPGFDLLCQSLRKKQLEIAKLLISHGCSLGKRGRGNNALHVAVIYGDFEIVRMIKNKGYSSNDKNNKGMTALHLFSQRHPVDEECPQILRLLVEGIININKIKHFQSGFTPLHFAAKCDNAEMISLLRKVKCDINARAEEGRTPLHIAALNGQGRAVHTLLIHGANQNLTDNKNKTALCLAVERQDVPTIEVFLKNTITLEKDTKLIYSAIETMNKVIVEVLLKHGVSPNSRPPKIDKAPIHTAVEKGSLEIVSLLLQYGADPNILRQTRRSRSNRKQHSIAYTALQIAAQKGNTGMVKLLLQYNADPRAQDPSAIETPLFFAAKVGSSEIVDIISKVSSDRAGEWQDGYFSLFVAPYHGHEDVVNKLLEKGVDPNMNIRNYLTPLQAAAQKGHETIVKILLEHQTEVNPKCIAGNYRFSTPLIAAVLSGNVAIIEILLNQGADTSAEICSKPEERKSKAECLLTYGYYSFSEVLSEKFKMGCKMIHFAAASGKKEVVEMILKRGADVNAKAEDNSTPLYVAVEKQHEDVVSYLLEYGASTDAKYSGGFVLLKAVELKNVNIVKLLLKHKAPINFKCSSKQKEGYTPLHIAIMKSSLEIVEVLLEAGAIVDTSSEVDLPLHLAVEKNDEKIISKLIEHGACIDSKCSLGLTPLFHAVANLKTKAFKSLVKLGASLNVKNSKGQSLLHYAVNGNIIGVFDIKDHMIRLTLECGTNVNSEYPSNISAFAKVIAFKRSDGKFKANYRLLKLFFAEGFDVSSRIDGSTQTVLLYAAKIGNTKAVKLLLQHDVDVNILDVEKHTAFHYAIGEARKIVYDLDENLVTENYSSYGSFMIDDQHIELARSMTEALARMQASGLALNAQNLALIKSNFVQYYYNRCKQELEELKQRKITKHVTYFNILIANEYKLAAYASNENIIEALEFKNLKEFPLYEEELKARFERGVTRKHVFEISTNILNDIFEINVPLLVTDEIFKYLRCVDLKNLCRARRPLMFVT